MGWGVRWPSRKSRYSTVSGAVLVQARRLPWYSQRRLPNGGSFRISLSQPLRVEGGRTALSIPIGRTKDGNVLRSSLGADLTPSVKQLDVSARWHHPLANGGKLRFDAPWMRNPGHNACIKPAMSFMARWLFEF